MFVMNEKFYQDYQLIQERQLIEHQKLIEKEIKSLNEKKYKEEKTHSLKFFKEGNDCVELKQLKETDNKYIMSDEVKRILWPIQSQSEHDDHWESFNKSRGK